MRKFNEQEYCGWCGSKVVYKSEWSSTCDECGYKNYIVPRACVGAILTVGGKIVMIKRAQHPRKDTYDFPGGFMDMDDSSIEETTYREIFEELGIKKSDLKNPHYLGSLTSIGEDYEWMDSAIRNIAFYHTFEIESFKDKINIDKSEHKDYILVDSSNIDSVDFTWKRDRRMAEKVLTRE